MAFSVVVKDEQRNQIGRPEMIPEGTPLPAVGDVVVIDGENTYDVERRHFEYTSEGLVVYLVVSPTETEQ